MDMQAVGGYLVGHNLKHAQAVCGVLRHRARADVVAVPERDLGERRVAQQFPWFADTEEARGKPGAGPGLSCWFVVGAPAGIEPATEAKR
jgi:hypothetical protein